VGKPADLAPGGEDDHRIVRLASLAEPVRRALYRWVIAQRAPVTREQAAAGVGVAHHVAKFNLDRLVAEGLLDADYRRPEGRGGPGAGRPAKVYRRGTAVIEVSVPQRHYDLAGLVLARAVASAERTDAPIASAVHREAVAHGRELARGSAATKRSAIRKVADVLAVNGYEPCVDKDSITLANCPFHALAREETHLVCGMNLALIEGIIDGANADGVEAVLQPCEGQCCVRVQRR